MNDAYGDPPPFKRTFGSIDEKIEYLVDQLVYWYCKPDSRRARTYAGRLASLLKEGDKDSGQFSEEWAAICDARGNTQEAIRHADVTISTEKARWVAYNHHDRKTKWFRDDVRSLQDALYLQAGRHLRIGERENAKRRMIEAAKLARQHGVPLDDDATALFDELVP